MTCMLCKALSACIKKLCCPFVAVIAVGATLVVALKTDNHTRALARLGSLLPPHENLAGRKRKRK